MAQDKIVVFNVLFPIYKALINEKSSKYKMRFLKIFDRKLFCHLLDRSFEVLTEFLTSDQSVRSVRVTLVAIKVLEPVYPEETLMQ